MSGMNGVNSAKSTSGSSSSNSSSLSNDMKQLVKRSLPKIMRILAEAEKSGISLTLETLISLAGIKLPAKSLGIFVKLLLAEIKNPKLKQTLKFALLNSQTGKVEANTGAPCCASPLRSEIKKQIESNLSKIKNPGEVKTILFEIWDEYEGKNSENKEVDDFIANYLKKHKIQYTVKELIKLNAGRTNQRLFNPYGLSEGMIYPDLSRPMSVIPKYSSVKSLVKQVFDHPEVKKFEKKMKGLMFEVPVSARRFVNLAGVILKGKDVESFKKLFLKGLVKRVLSDPEVKKSIEEEKEDEKMVEVSVGQLLGLADLKLEDSKALPLFSEFVKKEVEKDKAVKIVDWEKKKKETYKKVAAMFGNKNLYSIFQKIDRIKGIELLFDMEEIRDLFVIYDEHGSDPAHLAIAIAKWAKINDIEINGIRIRARDIKNLVRILGKFEKEMDQSVKKSDASSLIRILRDLTDPVETTEKRVSLAIRNEKNLPMQIMMMGMLGRFQMGATRKVIDEHDIEERFSEAIAKSKSVCEKVVYTNVIEKLRKITLPILVNSVRALGRLKARNAVPVIIGVALQKESHKKLLKAAVIALGQIADPQAVDFLVDLIRDNNTFLSAQKLAVVALGRIGDKRAVAFLKKVAFEWAGGLNVLALQTIAQFPQVISDPSFKARLAKLLKSEDFELRRTATMILAGLDDRRALPGLKKMLSKYIILPDKVSKLFKDDRSLLKELNPLLAALYSRTAGILSHEVIIKLLGDFKDSSSILPLMLLAKKEPKLNKPILQAVVKIMEHKKAISLPELFNLLDHKDGFVRKYAAIILGYVGDEKNSAKMIAALIKKLDDPEILVQREAILALARLGRLPYNSNVTLDKLAGVLMVKYKKNSGDPISQSLLVKALGKIKSKLVLPFLPEALNSKHYKVREAAIVALAVIGKRGTNKDSIAKRLMAEYGRSDKKARIMIVKGLALIRSKNALPFLKERYYALIFKASQSPQERSPLSMRSGPREENNLALFPNKESLRQSLSQDKEIRYLKVAIGLIENGNGKIKLASQEVKK